MKNIFLFALIAVLFASCGESGQSLNGSIKGANNLQVTLDQVFFDRNNTVSIGKATCDAEGKFKLKVEKPMEEGLYRLTIGAKRVFFILNGEEKNVDISGDINTIDRMELSVNGSETFACYNDIIKQLINNQVKNPDDAKAAVAKGCTPLMRAFLATQVFGQNAPLFINEFKKYNAELSADLPGSPYTNSYATMVGQLEKQATQQAGGAEETGPIQIGMQAPEISLPDPKGKTRSLSSLRGKVVLLDFWASWCGPCRRANPHVVETYKKYKSQGFEVFSVSLDRPDGKDKWLQAIQQDGLLWDNHVSDLKFWDCEPAQAYGVRSIPRTFLIDRAGKIVAINPRDNLEAELTKAL